MNSGFPALAHKILQYRILHDRVLDYLVSLGILAGGIILTRIFRRLVLSRIKAWAEKTETRLDDFVVAGIEKAALPIFYLGVFYSAAVHLAPAAAVRKVMDISAAVLLGIFAIRFLIAGMRHSADIYWRRDRDAAKRQIFAKLFPVIQVLIWAVGIIFLLQNLGFHISSLVAGLGLGGVAVALAAQAVLKDVFSYFVILFDRPFELNDFIIVSGSDLMGTIEHVGIRTTRVRSLSGELLIFANSDLTSSRLKNYKTLQDRRIQFNIGVGYDTDIEDLKNLPDLIATVIKGFPGVTFERAHFFSFDASCLTFQVVYHVLSADYNRYMDVQHGINLAIAEEFKRRGIEVPFQTQTIHLKQEK
ncbi:MAG: mechanosensitive ion channel family protein [Nitrospiraceae bacterium]|nr:mechanosensitive ion channel family protein [Nitrospiraceae bacterium]